MGRRSEWERIHEETSDNEYLEWTRRKSDKRARKKQKRWIERKEQKSKKRKKNCRTNESKREMRQGLKKPITHFNDYLRHQQQVINGKMDRNFRISVCKRILHALVIVCMSALFHFVCAMRGECRPVFLNGQFPAHLKCLIQLSTAIKRTAQPRRDCGRATHKNRSTCFDWVIQCILIRTSCICFLWPNKCPLTADSIIITMIYVFCSVAIFFFLLWSIVIILFDIYY